MDEAAARGAGADEALACGEGAPAGAAGAPTAEAAARRVPTAGAGRASSAAAETGTSAIVICRAASGGTGLPPTVIASASGRAVRISGPLASAGTT